jgi:hypothetical protein
MQTGAGGVRARMHAVAQLALQAPECTLQYTSIDLYEHLQNKQWLFNKKSLKNKIDTLASNICV